jgi:hypothetical protein
MTSSCAGLQLQPIVSAQHDMKLPGTMRPMCRHEAQWPTWPSRPDIYSPKRPSLQRLGSPAQQRSVAASWLYKPPRPPKTLAPYPPYTPAPRNRPAQPRQRSRATPTHTSARLIAGQPPLPPSSPRRLPRRSPRAHPRRPPLLNPRRPDLRRRPPTSFVPTTTRSTPAATSSAPLPARSSSAATGKF